MLKTEKAERLEIYQDRDTQVFLNKFLSGEIGDLEPTYDPKQGYIYPTVQPIVGDYSRVEFV